MKNTNELIKTLTIFTKIFAKKIMSEQFFYIVLVCLRDMEMQLLVSTPKHTCTGNVTPALWCRKYMDTLGSDVV